MYYLAAIILASLRPTSGFAQALPASSKEQAATIINDLKTQNRILKVENEQLRDALAAHGIVIGENYSSAAQILKGLPAELQAAAKWDKFNFEKVLDWLNTEPVAKSFEAVLPIRSITIGRSSRSQDAPWEASIQLAEPNFGFGKKLFRQHLTVGWPQPFSLYGDEDFAQRMEKLKPGTRVRVSGKIRAISFGAEERNQREMRITLVDHELQLP